MPVWRELKKIAEHLNEQFKKGRYDPMRPETLPFTYKDLEDWCRANESDLYNYIDPSERGGINGHYADENMYNLEEVEDDAQTE